MTETRMARNARYLPKVHADTTKEEAALLRMGVVMFWFGGLGALGWGVAELVQQGARAEVTANMLQGAVVLGLGVAMMFVGIAERTARRLKARIADLEIAATFDSSEREAVNARGRIVQRIREAGRGE